MSEKKEEKQVQVWHVCLCDSERNGDMIREWYLRGSEQDVEVYLESIGMSKYDVDIEELEIENISDLAKRNEEEDEDEEEEDEEEEKKRKEYAAAKYIQEIKEGMRAAESETRQSETSQSETCQ